MDQITFEIPFNSTILGLYEWQKLSIVSERSLAQPPMKMAGIEIRAFGSQKVYAITVQGLNAQKTWVMQRRNACRMGYTHHHPERSRNLCGTS